MELGDRFGDYEVIAILGSGGMGQVCKVRNLLSDRIEAMKVPLSNLGGEAMLAERFLREIKVQAALDHPNIARLHTAQVIGNRLIMVMEYVEGSTIETLLQHGTLSLLESISYANQVLDALAYAHARGVIHRDIKPANIVRTPQGLVKLVDFGIARMQAGRRLTVAGHTVGSLFYMSPEQIIGGEVDPRSDLYSLGITLYEMVTGRRPFEATSDYSIMAAHLQQMPSAPIEVVPGTPQDLSDIILMAIAKEPAQRFQTAHAFRGALTNIGGTEKVRPPARRTVTAAKKTTPASVASLPSQVSRTLPVAATASGSLPSAAALVEGSLPVARRPLLAATGNRTTRNWWVYFAVGAVASFITIAGVFGLGYYTWKLTTVKEVITAPISPMQGAPLAQTLPLLAPE